MEEDKNGLTITIQRLNDKINFLYIAIFALFLVLLFNNVNELFEYEGSGGAITSIVSILIMVATALLFVIREFFHRRGPDGDAE